MRKPRKKRALADLDEEELELTFTDPVDGRRKRARLAPESMGLIEYRDPVTGRRYRPLILVVEEE